MEEAVIMYTVYFNVPHDKAIVHKSACSFSNDGEGINRDASRNIDGWMTFDDRDRAFLAAYKTGANEVRSCLKCNA